MQNAARDRYISFAGLDCDENAVAIVALIRTHIADRDKAGPWADYFARKFEEQERMGVDDLFLVASQINALYALFETCGDQGAIDLVYQVEQECC